MTHRTVSPDSRTRRGFTLLEVLIAVALIGVVAAILVPYFLAELHKAKQMQAVGDLRMIEAELEVFQAEHGDLPDDLSGVDLDDKRDPWGYGYRYFPFKGNNWRGSARKDQFLVPLNSTYDLYSVGPDGETRPPLTAQKSWDDIVRANDGHFMGPGAEY